MLITWLEKMLQLSVLNQSFSLGCNEKIMHKYLSFIKFSQEKCKKMKFITLDVGDKK